VGEGGVVPFELYEPACASLTAKPLIENETTVGTTKAVPSTIFRIDDRLDASIRSMNLALMSLSGMLRPPRFSYVPSKIYCPKQNLLSQAKFIGAYRE
jgi:hypothetical protein